MNTIEQLRKLAEARAKATAGEWLIVPTTDGGSVWCASAGPRMLSRDKGIVMEANDASFVALAGSTDFRAILADYEAMSRVVEAAKEEAESPISYASKWKLRAAVAQLKESKP